MMNVCATSQQQVQTVHDSVVTPFFCPIFLCEHTEAKRRNISLCLCYTSWLPFRGHSGDETKRIVLRARVPLYCTVSAVV